MELVISKGGRMTRTMPELADFHATLAGGRLTPLPIVQQAEICGGFSVESYFDPGTLQSRSRDPTTRPPLLNQFFLTGDQIENIFENTTMLYLKVKTEVYHSKLRLSNVMLRVRSI
ncbi:hypothetical protein AVEN_165087-1 [Araneus ventricosus]|uniref:Uncharacterized protein n=1 Tax=Araneus ventricosus TaxID=182803 RepID=A0A4Y2PET2_ARAVE|nr:hypothetical protein AVEN_165087-1 [Araneus ventricosus]